MMPSNVMSICGAAPWYRRAWDSTVAFFERPRSLFARMRDRRRGPASTSSLYVVEVGFELSPAKRAEYDEVLDGLKKKYGLDFFIVEPGFKFKRFDDF